MKRHPRPRFLSLLVAAACTAASLPAHPQLAAGALPSGWTVRGGSATLQQNGATLSIDQGSSRALIDFRSFSVGSGALVDIRQPGASSALLARILGGDASQIDGQVRSNGSLWLINPAGIMIGAGARIDVGSFIGSTLSVSDRDFLAGRLNFTSTGSAGPLANAGAVRAASGGSIYLVAPSVVNTGSLTAPQGEIVLAAGQNVQLIDTATPGVSVALTGTAGEVRNLGRITAEAGRIGIAAGLVGNAGTLSADSAVSVGGRIFLRATQDLQTTATSNVTANGTSGGRIDLVADGAAAIDGRVSATGSAGPGGQVDTSGHRWLDVRNAPVVGRGGEWHIDPYSLEVVADAPGGTSNAQGVVVSDADGARVTAGSIASQLNAGVDVTLTTGAGGSPTGGDITVSAPIAKTAGGDAALTLNASRNITINAPITSRSGALGLNLRSNYQGDPNEAGHAATLNADLDLNGGVLLVSQGDASGNGTLAITGGTTRLNASGSAITAAAVDVGPGAAMSIGSDQSVDGVWTNHGAIDVHGDGSLSVSGSFVNSGLLTTSGSTTFALAGRGDGSNVVNHGTIAKTSGADQQYTSITNADDGVIRVDAGDLLLYTSTLGGQLQASRGGNLTLDTDRLTSSVGFSGAGSMVWSGSVTLLGNVDIAAAAPALTFDATRLTVVQGSGFALSTRNAVSLDGGNLLVGAATQWNNHGSFTVGGVNPGSLGFVRDATGAFDNKAGGVLTIGDNSRVQLSGGAVLTNEAGGTIAVTSNGTDTFSAYGVGSFVNAGSLVKSGSATIAAPIRNLAGGSIRIDQGGLGVDFSESSPNAGSITVAAGALLDSSGHALHNSGTLRGAGVIALGGSDGATLYNHGVVAPGTPDATGTLSVQGSFVQGADGALTVRLGNTASDRLDVDGSAQLNGTLNLASFNGVLPSNGAGADVVTARGANSGGTFSRVVAPAITTDRGTATLSVSYPAGSTLARVAASTVPSLGVCTASPALSACRSVLPTLDQCIANGATPGCSVVLPTTAVCLVSPSTPGCAQLAPITTAPVPDPAPVPSPAPTPTPTPTPVSTTPPSADICIAAPDSTLCKVLSAPAASDPVRPVQQASNVVIAVLSTATVSPVTSAATSSSKGSDTAMATADAAPTSAKGAAVKKMYCN